MQNSKIALLMCACSCLCACGNNNNGHTQEVEALLREDINKLYYYGYLCRVVKLDVYYVDLIKDTVLKWYDPEQQTTLSEKGDFELYYVEYSFMTFLEENKFYSSTVFSREISILYSPEMNKYEEIWYKNP